MHTSLRRLACAAVGALTVLGAAGPTTALAGTAGTAAAPAVNLATNPGFEIPTLPLADWGSIPGWQCASGEAAVGAGAARTGTAGLTVTPANDHSNGECAQTVAVRPNSSYTYSAWVRGSYVFLGATGTGNDVAPAWTETTSGGWQKLTTRFTTGPNASTVRLYLHGWYQQGAFSADDVELSGPAVDPAWATWNVPYAQAIQDKKVFFTIDDGWARPADVVSFVEANHLPVTTFPLSMPIGFEPDYFQRVSGAGTGGSVEAHSVSHRDLTTLPLAEQQAEICDARDVITKRYGTVPKVFRPPYFAFNADTLQAAANCGLRTVMTATADYSWGASNSYHGGLQAGDVVIFHFSDTLAADLQRALADATAAGLTVGGLRSYLS
ncbi:polysaccharide deacetylase family protein [Kitasatospora sp. NPDC096147]|uniref:polysaccharide deacetylase family protein n=1 Tax=Kitasatospora sp. NPDC096147 TaxID=3364093 RepID=UPI003825784F